MQKVSTNFWHPIKLKLSVIFSFLPQINHDENDDEDKKETNQSARITRTSQSHGETVMSLSTVCMKIWLQGWWWIDCLIIWWFDDLMVSWSVDLLIWWWWWDWHQSQFTTTGQGHGIAALPTMTKCFQFHHQEIKNNLSHTF